MYFKKQTIMFKTLLRMLRPAKQKPVGRWQVGGNWERRAMLATLDS